MSYTHIVYDVVYDVVCNVAYDINCCSPELYSWALAAAAKRRHFMVSAPLRLDAKTRAHRISSASFTETFLGNALP